MLLMCQFALCCDFVPAHLSPVAPPPPTPHPLKSPVVNSLIVTAASKNVKKKKGARGQRCGGDETDSDKELGPPLFIFSLFFCTFFSSSVRPGTVGGNP